MSSEAAGTPEVGNPRRRISWRKWADLGFEYSLVLLMFAGLRWTIRAFLSNGYLPDPFFNDADATFTDWFDPAFFSHNPGAYDSYGSVYPPMAFVFLRVFSLGHCYRAEANTIYSQARYCDPLGIPTLIASVLIGFVLSLLAFRKAGISAALPRALAVSIGCPMLWALERGNLIVPCYVFFVLAHGRILKSGWAKAVCAAVALNFKPYLLLSFVGRILRRDWRWSEAVVVSLTIIWAISYAIIGDGSPGTVLGDIFNFSSTVAKSSLGSLHFTTSFFAIYQFVTTNSVIRYIGSQPVEQIEFWAPLITKTCGLATLLCVAGAVAMPKALPASRISALVMVFYYVWGGPGGYAMSFVLFLLFLEKWQGLNGKILLLAAYLWCVPWDKAVYHVWSHIEESFLSNTTINRAINVQLGDFLRPALMLVIELTLLFASGRDLIAAALSPRRRAPDAGLAKPAASPC